MTLERDKRESFSQTTVKRQKDFAEFFFTGFRNLVEKHTEPLSREPCQWIHKIKLKINIHAN